MYFDVPNLNILKISRSKLNGIGKHFGVHLRNGYVVHLTVDHQIEFTTPEGFAQGRDVDIESAIPEHQHQAVMDRLRLALANPRPYHLGEWNCETFANWITEGKSESQQVTGVVALAGLALTVAAIASL